MATKLTDVRQAKFHKQFHSMALGFVMPRSPRSKIDILSMWQWTILICDQIIFFQYQITHHPKRNWIFPLFAMNSSTPACVCRSLLFVSSNNIGYSTLRRVSWSNANGDRITKIKRVLVIEREKNDSAKRSKQITSVEAIASHVFRNIFLQLRRRKNIFCFSPWNYTLSAVLQFTHSHCSKCNRLLMIVVEFFHFHFCCSLLLTNRQSFSENLPQNHWWKLTRVIICIPVRSLLCRFVFWSVFLEKLCEYSSHFIFLEIFVFPVEKKNY